MENLVDEVRKGQDDYLSVKLNDAFEKGREQGKKDVLKELSHNVVIKQSLVDEVRHLQRKRNDLSLELKKTLDKIKSSEVALFDAKKKHVDYTEKRNLELNNKAASLKELETSLVRQESELKKKQEELKEKEQEFNVKQQQVKNERDNAGLQFKDFLVKLGK